MRQAIIYNNADLVILGHMGKYFNQNWVENQYISSIFDQLKMSSAFSRQKVLGVEGLNIVMILGRRPRSIVVWTPVNIMIKVIDWL